MLISGACDNGKSYNSGDDRRVRAGDQAQCRFACRPYRFTREADSVVVFSASVFNHRRFCLYTLAIDSEVSPHKNGGASVAKPSTGVPINYANTIATV